ncbi:helix-turn-helix domain-containing protein [Halomicronema hongdechloris]|nr:RodZ domain-containing protein [Halomicronema hongdechloris]
MKHKQPQLETIYREQLLEIGEILRQTREAQHQSLEHLAGQTLIRAKVLSSLETADLEELPEPVYIRGLIRRYGNALGLDGETLASQFFTPATLRRRVSWKESPAAQLRPLHLYVAYILLMVVAISGLSYVLKRTAPTTSQLPALEPLAPNATEPQSPASTPTTMEPENPAASSQPDKPIRVEMTLTAQSWIRIIADGTTTFEGVLPEGEQRLWTADERLVIRAGNAGGVMVSYNDGSQETLGKPGMVTEVAFPPNLDNPVSLAF